MCEIVLASTSAIKRRAVAQFFNVPMSRVACVACDSLNLPPQPVGSGELCAKARALHAHGLRPHATIVAVENEIVGAQDVCRVHIFTPYLGHCTGKSAGVSFDVKFFNEAVRRSAACDFAFAGLAVTVGALMHEEDASVDACDWVGGVVYASRHEQILAALADALTDAAYTAARLARAVTVVPDFPRPGVRFKDLSALIANRRAFAELMDVAAGKFTDQFGVMGVNKLVGLDARGFIYGAALARELGLGFVMARKRGKLPPVGLVETAYATEYSTEALQMCAHAVTPGDRVVVVDDLVATGGSLKAAVELVHQCGGVAVGCLVVLAVEPLLQAARQLVGTPLVVVLPDAADLDA
jgi:adenine phosphoribosyltransferase